MDIGSIFGQKKRTSKKNRTAFQLNSKLQCTVLFTEHIIFSNCSSRQVAWLFNVIFPLFSAVSPKHGNQLTKPGSSFSFYPGATDSKSDKRIDGESGPEREKSNCKSQSVCNKISIHKGRGWREKQGWTESGAMSCEK